MADFPEIDIDLWADDVLADPYPAYANLRGLGPVVWMSRHQAYAVTHYAAVRAVLQDWETYSSAAGVGMTDEMNAKTGGVLTTDPPEHDPLRAVLNSQLATRRLVPHREFLAAEARALVDTLVSRGSFEAVTEVAQAYSVKIVADLVGFPDRGRNHLLDRAAAAFNTFGPDNELLRTSVDGLRELFSYCDGVTEELWPGGWGAGIYEAGRRGDVDQHACVGLVLAYAWAGMDTTVNAISASLKLFAEHQRQWSTLADDRGLMAGAINEVLRIEPPVQRFSRRVTRAAELEGHTLPRGARVIVLFGAANRDPAKFEHPDRFDITRNPSAHLSFGRGVHRCVGANLAQLEMEAILSALLDHDVGLEVTGLQWRRNNALHGLARLHMRVLR